MFHRDRFLCRAISPEHAGETITLKDIQTARAAHRRALREQMAARRAAVAEYLPTPSSGHTPTGAVPTAPATPPAANPPVTASRAANLGPPPARSRPPAAPTLHLYQADFDPIDLDGDADPSDGEEHP